MLNQGNRKKTVLIIDDSPINIEHLAQVLKSEYHIKVANNGASGVAVARSQKPDLILLDIMMPEMDGYQVCRILKADDATRKIPIIFITAKTDTKDETKGLSLGAVDYITKPFRTPIVQARVRTHIRLKHNTDLLEKLAMVDGLTGLPNRRRFEQLLKREWSRARRAQEPLSVIMLDIDHFKQFNDHYGHQAGDRCLARVAQALPVPLKRPTDVIFRYGGEEFIAVLPNTDLNFAMNLAEQMRAEVGRLLIPHQHTDGDHPFLSISLGVATAVPHSRISPSDLVGQADRQLYEAKDSGRNTTRGVKLTERSDEDSEAREE